MAEYMIRDRMRELWQQIDQQHLSYLHADESPRKLDEKKRLDGFIKEFLCMVPHERKFYFRETGEVLHRTVENKENFSLYKTTAGWAALAAYAHNLLAQPWRKEFHEIKTYCGYYKHNLDSSLVGAELMLEAMGYKHADSSTLILDGPVDPDRVTMVSRDSLVALVECQIMRSIYSEVIKTISTCTWLEVLQYREACVSTVEQAVRGLIFRLHQRRYEEQQYRGHIDCYGTVSRYHHPIDTCPYAAPRYYNTLHTVPRFGVVSPQQSVPPYPVYHIQPHELYATNNHYPVRNGYIPLNIPPPPVMIPNYACSVPTAQLIELDTSSEPPIYSVTHKRNSSDHRIEPDRKNGDKYPSDMYSRSTTASDDRKSKKDNWDWAYVYQKLEEKNGIKKDEPDRIRDKRPPSPMDLGDALKHFSLDDLHQISIPEKPKINETLNKTRIDNEQKKLETNRVSIYDNSSPPGNSPKQTLTLARETNTKKNDDSKFFSVDNRKLRVKLNDKWECVTCTYHNSGSTEVCEICGKSRSKGGESKPLASGGRQCPHCTLVNEKGVTTCDACGSSLKDSPTYI